MPAFTYVDYALNKILVAFFTVSFYGRACETVQTDENMGKNAAPKSRSP